jgi:hypothetical protein
MSFAILLLTVLSSASAAAYVTYYLNLSRERLFFLSQKSEELYQTVEALDAELINYYADQYSLLGGPTMAAEGRALATASRLFSTSRMLIGLYFPALAPELTRLSAATSSAQHCLKRSEDMPGSTEHLEVLDSTIYELKAAFNALERGIFEKTGRARRQRFLGLQWKAPTSAKPQMALQQRALT